MRAAIIYAVLLLAATVKIASMPKYSFDSYQYSYLVSSDIQRFKSLAGLPREYAQMGDKEYEHQRPFYRVKVLYVILVSIAAKFAGVIRAPFVVSAVAYFLLGWVVWFWLGSARIPEPWRSLSAILFMFSSVTTDTARMGTPDLLCTLLLMLGAWLLLETKYVVAGGVTLVISVFARLDCAILAVALLLLGYCQQKVSKRITLTLGVALVASYLLISRLGYSYHEMLAWTLRTSYLKAILHNFMKTELAIYSPFALLAVFAIKKKYERGLIGACVASLAVRYVLMPHLEIRYLLPQALIAGVVGAAAVLQGKAVGGVEAASSLAPQDVFKEVAT
jgi:hypothetical protein